jgi:endonuclease/exonuclease/phosphatase family metal-dependent hydrolase
VDVTITRGWISVDATVHGQAVRVIARHLESFYEPVQEAQAAELVAGPGATTLPVAIAGDLNTGPGSAQTASYAFPHGSCRVHGHLGRDVRAEQSRVTDSYYTDDPFTVVPGGPSERIDLVLVHGAAVSSAPKDYLVGTEIPHPSDHATSSPP